MKQSFIGYYRLSEPEFRRLWEESTLFIDANVLLNLYGYSQKTSDELLRLIEAFAGRICIPYQFALEYQRNRAHAIMEQVKNYAAVERILNDVYNQHLVPKTKHPFISDRMMQSFKRLIRELADSRESHEELFTTDAYHARVTALLDGRVGRCPTPEELENLHAAAKRRYDARIPPGFADAKEKEAPDCYGDYVGWVQLMEIARETKRPALLVTDDKKEDWWQIQEKRTIGPRPELIAEFTRECGTPFYMYSSDQFMRFANVYLGESVDLEAIEEVLERMQARLRAVAEAKAIPSDLKMAAADNSALDLKVSPGVSQPRSLKFSGCVDSATPAPAQAAGETKATGGPS